MTGIPTLDVTSIVKFFFILFRVGGVFMVSPLLSNRSVPTRIKLCIAIFISLLMMPLTAPYPSSSAGSLWAMLSIVIQELSIGFIIGFAASIVFAAIQFAGEIFGLQMGYSMSSILDPANLDQASVITSFYIILGGLFFLYVDGHHTILSALIKSFQYLPLGKGFSVAVGYTLSDLVARLLVFSIQIASPMLVVIAVLNTMFGLISKLSPQMNIYFNVGFIIGPLVGFSVLILSLPLFRILIVGMTQNMEGDLLRVIRAMKGAV